MMKSLVCAMLFVCAVATGPVHAQAWHEQYKGKEIPAHYVKLVGFAGDKDADRRRLYAEHLTCVRVNKNQSKPYVEVALDDIPALVNAHTVEIYYAANRMLARHTTNFSAQDRETCAITQKQGGSVTIQSMTGACEINVDKKVGVGQCNMEIHRNAPVWRQREPQGNQVPEEVLKTLTPEQRVKVQEGYARAQAMAGIALNDPMGSATGETRTVHGTQCTVYRMDVAKTERCVVNPKQVAGMAVAPYPIASVGLNGGISGLLLSTKSPALTLDAVDIRWNQRVSQEVFKLPAGLKIQQSMVAVP